MSYKSVIIGLTGFVMLLQSCKKNATILPQDYPFVIMKGISNIDSTGITASAEIVSLGNDSIVDYGFVWNISGAPVLDNFRQSAPYQPATGKFSERISNGIHKNITYSIRPYIVSKTYISYGNTMTFTGEGSLPFSLNDFTPKSGKAGSEVTITGNNLNNNAQVYFGSVKANVLKGDGKSLTVEVPDIPYNQYINVQQDGKKITFPQAFQIIYPWSAITLPGAIISQTVLTGFALNGKGYFIVGTLSSGHPPYEVWEFDPADNSWQQKNNFPGTPRETAISFVIGKKAYYGLGLEMSYTQNGSDISKVLKDIWEYDPSTDTWSQKSDFPYSYYYFDVCFTNGDKAYFGLGNSYNMSTTIYSQDLKFWSYSPASDTWNTIPQCPLNLFKPTSFTVGNSSFIGPASNDPSEFYTFNPDLQSWTYAFTYPGQGKYYVQNIVINDKVYIGLGNNNSNICKDFWLYDPAVGAWKKLPNFPKPSAMRFSFSIGNKGYFYDSFGSVFWMFDLGKI